MLLIMLLKLCKQCTTVKNRDLKVNCENKTEIHMITLYKLKATRILSDIHKLKIAVHYFWFKNSL